MVSDFNKYVLPYLHNFIKVNIDYSQLKKIDDCAFKLLNVSDFGKLNDKYDGQLFYQKFKNQTLAEIAVEKFFKESFIDWEQKKANVNYKPKFCRAGDYYGIISAPFGELPIVPSDSGEKIVVCFIADKKTVWLSGIINTNDKNVKFIPPSFFLAESNYRGYLSSFNLMCPLESII